MNGTKSEDGAERRIAGLPVTVPEGWSVQGSATRCTWSGPWNLTVTVERGFLDPEDVDVRLDCDPKLGTRSFKLASATVPEDLFDVSRVLREVSSIAGDHGPGLEVLRNEPALSLALSEDRRRDAVETVGDVRDRFRDALRVREGMDRLD